MKSNVLTWARLTLLAAGAACFGIIANASAEDLVPLQIKLPAPAFIGTPSDTPVPANVDKPTGKPRPPLMVPPGVSNVALGKTVTSSAPNARPAELSKITDGNKEATENNIVLLRKGVQWVQIDLGKPYEIYAIVVWHAHDTQKVYHGVVAQVADNADFTENVRTLFNNEMDNGDGLGVGTSHEYFESNEGKLIEGKGAVARYVRLYSRGSTESHMNEYTEVEVYGRASGQNSAPDTSWNPDRSPQLQQVLDAAVQTTLSKFAPAKLGADQLAVTVIDLRDPQHPVQASYRGETQIYPASVVKLFYLAAAHRWLEDKRIEDTPELRRALRDMIVDSFNEATGYVVDVLTGTTSGPELPRKEIEEWWDKRNAVNRYFASLGYTNINVNKKPWCEGPYGRETEAIELFKPTRNQLTTDATARLMTEIVTGKDISPDRCRQMMELLRRESGGTSSDSNSQAVAFTGMGIPPGTKLWSKAGWTSETRHDCAYLELPDGRRLVLVTFTVDHANERQIIPTLARTLIAGWPKN